MDHVVDRRIHAELLIGKVQSRQDPIAGPIGKNLSRTTRLIQTRASRIPSRPMHIERWIQFSTPRGNHPPPGYHVLDRPPEDNVRSPVTSRVGTGWMVTAN